MPSVTTASLATATDGQTGYSQTLAGTGGTTPYTWSVTTGSLPTGLSLNAGTGAIAGTLGGSATSQTFIVTLTDADGVTATKSLTITVNAASAITTASLPGATAAGTYNQTVVATGGTAPNTWSITNGVLPTGLSLNAATGAITGTVDNAAVSETFTVQVINTNGGTASQSLTITANAVPSITSSSPLPGGTHGSNYVGTIITGTGGTTNYTWSITSGSLPTGLSLNAATGAITGTVGAGATSQTFTATLTDANGVTATKSLTITVNAVPSVTTASLATATDGQTGYSQTLAGTGGTTPYTWSVTTGSLPTGLSLNAGTGAIAGTLGGSATSQTFIVTLTDADGVTATKSLTITVNAASAITTASLPGATAAGTYNQTVVATGGTAPNTWSITNGVLPTGLSLNAATGAITGTVDNAAVSETFTVQVINTNGGTASQSLTITANAVPSITSSSPLPGGTHGSNYVGTIITGTGGTTNYTWSITSGSLPTGLSLNAATGAITGTVGAGATSQTFTVTLTDADGVTASKSFTLTIS